MKKLMLLALIGLFFSMTAVAKMRVVNCSDVNIMIQEKLKSEFKASHKDILPRGTIYVDLSNVNRHLIGWAYPPGFPDGKAITFGGKTSINYRDLPAYGIKNVDADGLAVVKSGDNYVFIVINNPSDACASR